MCFRLGMIGQGTSEASPIAYRCVRLDPGGRLGHSQADRKRQQGERFGVTGCRHDGVGKSGWLVKNNEENERR